MKWKLKALAEITHVVTKGTTPTTMGRPFTSSGINFIKAEALNGDSSLDSQSFAFIDDETHEALLRSKLEASDVLVTIAGASVGRCGFVKPEYAPANTNQAVGIVRVDKQKANPRFVYFFFKQPGTFALCQSLGAAQAAQPNVTLAALRGLQIPYPTIPEQNRIAEILSAYDDLIDNNRRRMGLLEKAARLLYEEWFVRLRFPGHEHTPITNGIPQGWERKKLIELCESVDYGYTASADQEAIGPKFLRITDIVPEFIDWASVPYCSIEDDRLAKFRLVEGDIVVARTGATVGYAKRIHKRHPETVFASYLVRLRPKADVENLLLGVFVESQAYKDYVKSRVGGAAQPNANAQVLAAAELLVPSATIQREFRDFVEPLVNQREVLQHQNQKLRAARDLLLPRLMSGEIAV